LIYGVDPPRIRWSDPGVHRISTRGSFQALVFLPILAAIASLALSAATHAHGADVRGAIRLDQTTDLITEWSGGGLYLAGSIELSDENVDDLATWLAQYPNWTVLLVERAEGLSYRDS